MILFIEIENLISNVQYFDNFFLFVPVDIFLALYPIRSKIS